MKKVFIILFGVILIYSCGGQRKLTRTSKTPRSNIEKEVKKDSVTTQLEKQDKQESEKSQGTTQVLQDTIDIFFDKSHDKEITIVQDKPVQTDIDTSRKAEPLTAITLQPVKPEAVSVAQPVMVEGFRVQVFAGASEQSAKQILQQIQNIGIENIHLEKDLDIWKVQIGDYTVKADAYTMRDKMKNMGFSEAWVVSRKVVSRDAKFNVSTEAVMIDGFRIQILASSSEVNAKLKADEWKSKVPEEEVYIENEGGLWKVQVGNCVTRSEADILKDKAVNLGFQSAFVVAKKIKKRN
jgi:Tfp pilus assembly protein FimT